MKGYKVLVISDTHGHNENFIKLLHKITDIDEIIHLGDICCPLKKITSIVQCPINVVLGNNDFNRELNREEIIHVGKYRILITHGHRQQVGFGVWTLQDYARSQGVDIVMFGHTHVPYIEYNQDLITLNPGSLSQPRQSGFRPSYAIRELNKKGDVHFTINYIY